MSDFDMNNEDLQQMYQEVILDASRHPHGRSSFAADSSSEQPGHVESATVRAMHEYCTAGESHQFNPTCGDEVTIHVDISQDEETPRIKGLVWDGQGCSISQASLSMMTDMVNGLTVDQAMDLFEVFRRLMQSRGAGLADEQDNERLGDAVVFQGVSKYPMRIKCALLGWEGLQDSIAKAMARRNEASSKDGAAAIGATGK